MTISAAAVSTPAAAERPVRAMLLVGALGVVFGDIGTSPIYAFRELLQREAPRFKIPWAVVATDALAE